MGTKTIRGDDSSKQKANTNVVLTEYEKSVLNKLCAFNADGDITNEVSVDSIYSKYKYDKANEDGSVTNVSFLSVHGGIKKGDNFVNATIVINDDKRFYLSMQEYDRDEKENVNDAMFINGLELMQDILSRLTGSNMSEEDLSKEVDAFNMFIKG